MATDTVLKICTLPESINVDRMKELVLKYMGSREEFLTLAKRPPSIESWFSELITSIASGGILIGSGSCKMDVKTKDNEGIDSTCLIMHKSGTNEKSIMQNFSKSGNNLDTLFDEKNDKEAVRLFSEGYREKLMKCKNEKKLDRLFILSFISTESEIYLVCFEINTENIGHVYSGGFVREEGGNCKNISVHNFIDPLYGNVNLYKSKKRLELRLTPGILESQYVVKLYTKTH